MLRRAGIYAPVLPLIVVSGAKRLTVKRFATWKGDNIGVTESPKLVRKLLRRAPRISDQQIERIAAAFVDPAAWSSRRLPESDALAVQAEYSRIMRGIDRWVRLWRSVLAALIVVGVPALIALYLYVHDAIEQLQAG